MSTSSISFHVTAKLAKRFGVYNITALVPCYDKYKIEDGFECKVTHAGNTYQLWFPTTLDPYQLDNYLQQFYPELFV